MGRNSHQYTRKGLWIAAAFIGVVVVLMMLPISAPDEKMNAEIACITAAVALHQHLFDYTQGGGTVDPDLQEQFDADFKTLMYRQRLQQRNDNGTFAKAFRPTMVAAEAARDRAVEADAAAYRSEAFARVATCTNSLSAALSRPSVEIA
jgi:Spy/CpxP family protein refolding chaperone